jgi:hypothetical protein
MELTKVVKKPGIGHEGRLIQVRTNFFEVTSLPVMNIVHYDVTITPEVPRRLNRKVFDRFIEQHQKHLGGARPVFDGTYFITEKLQIYQY